MRNLEEWITTQPEWAQQHLVVMAVGAFAVLALSLAVVGPVQRGVLHCGLTHQDPTDRRELRVSRKIVPAVTEVYEKAMFAKPTVGRSSR